MTLYPKHLKKLRCRDLALDSRLAPRTTIMIIPESQTPGNAAKLLRSEAQKNMLILNFSWMQILCRKMKPKKMLIES